MISGRPAADNFADYIRPLASDPAIKGVRQVLHGPGTPPGFCLDERFLRGIRLLGELGLSFDLCMRPGELATAPNSSTPARARGSSSTTAATPTSSPPT